MELLDKKMHRDSPFSFDCQACGHCCQNKDIQLNPYEVVRLADFLGLSTGRFLDKFIRPGSPFLFFSGNNDTCPFLTEQGCSVHPVRPLVCRLYPLGKYLSGDRQEHFKCIQPQPDCQGKLGERGTVADFLESQQTEPYMEASAQYLELFDRLHQDLYRKLEGQQIDPPDKDDGSLALDLAEWFDVDQMNNHYCKENGLLPPEDQDGRVKLHIRALGERLCQAREKTL